jgi:hypothetical protein
MGIELYHGKPGARGPLTLRIVHEVPREVHHCVDGHRAAAEEEQDLGLRGAAYPLTVRPPVTGSPTPATITWSALPKGTEPDGLVLSAMVTGTLGTMPGLPAARPSLR